MDRRAYYRTFYETRAARFVRACGAAAIARVGQLLLLLALLLLMSARGEPVGYDWTAGVIALPATPEAARRADLNSPQRNGPSLGPARSPRV
jgi:hypothetical protein